jgi:hypothetical protein
MNIPETYFSTNNDYYTLYDLQYLELNINQYRVFKEFKIDELLRKIMILKKKGIPEDMIFNYVENFISKYNLSRTFEEFQIGCEHYCSMLNLMMLQNSNNSFEKEDENLSKCIEEYILELEKEIDDDNSNKNS